MLNPLAIKLVPVTLLQQNCRIVYNQDTKQAFVVDPGGDADFILENLHQLKIQDVESIVLTHGHFDHIGGVTELRDKLEAQFGHQVPVIGPCKEDAFLFDQVVAWCNMFRLPATGFQDFTQRDYDYFVEPEQVVTLLGIPYQVKFCPGHSPGHAVYINHQDRFVLVGDVIFYHSVGRTDLIGGNPRHLQKSIQDHIFTLDDDYLLLPGHGPNTNVETERAFHARVSIFDRM